MKPLTNLALFFLALVFFCSTSLDAQVGVNTTNPTETLDVNGTTALRDLTTNSVSTTQLLGANNNGVVGGVEVGNNLELANGVLNATIGATRYLPVIITRNFFTNTFNNLDLDINGANFDRTLFILRGNNGGPSTTTFTGLAGGTDGRLIVIRADRQNFNIFIINESAASLPQNRFQFNNNPNQSENVNGFGSFTFVYVAAVQRWVLINREIL